VEPERYAAQSAARGGDDDRFPKSLGIRLLDEA
jgi:hypothetical protein